jgi:hypothetical protein
MVTPLSLAVVAFAATLLAFVVAFLRRLGPVKVTADWGAALACTLGTLLVALLLFTVSRPLDASPAWRAGGSLALLAAPVAASVALALRGRRSILRALVLSGVALGVVVLWLTLHLKGVRANWPAGEVALVTLLASVVVASAACIGWWSKRERASR